MNWGSLRFVAGCVARLEPGKGFDTLLTAAHLLHRSVPDLRVLIVGDHPDPENRRTVQRQIEQLSLTDTVVLAGWRSDIATCMRAMDVLAHPSRTESFGQVLIEAFAAGTPVVASDVGGIPEIVTPGQTGELVPAADPGALADAIRKLYDSPELRQEYVAAASVAAQERFTSQLMADRHLQYYLDWLGSSPARR